MFIILGFFFLTARNRSALFSVLLIIRVRNLEASLAFSQRK